MSQTIDEKVVELRFDNKQFESGVKESLSTLTKLKEAIKKNDGTKALEDLEKKANKIDLSKLADNVDMLSKRFSTLGIAGMRVISNITDGLMNGLGGAIKSVTGSIISGGFRRAMNIENARFQLQGVLGDAAKVEKVMKQASESVDGTAYAFDAAANAASMFAASGVDAGDQLKHALRGLAGATATFNADYQSMAMIWTKISGQGRVMGDELNQLSNRGMNAAVTIANYFNDVNKGTAEATDGVKEAIKSISKGLEVSEGDIRDFVSKGLISFDIFSEAMSQTFGEHAKDANKTFEGSLANIKAALARTGEGIFAPLIKQEGPMVHLFNAIRTKINEFNSAFRAANGVVETFTKWAAVVIEKLATWIDSFKIANTYIQKFGDGTSYVVESATKTMLKYGDEMIVGYRKIYTPFHALQDILYTLVNLGKGLLSVLKPIGEAFKDVFLTKENANGIYEFLEKLRISTTNMGLSAKHAEQLKRAFSGLFKVISSLVRLFGRLITAILGIKNPLTGVSDDIFDFIEGIGAGLDEFAKFIDTSPMIETAVKAIGDAFQWLVDHLAKAFGAIGEFFGGFDINDIGGSIAKKFDELGQAIYDALPPQLQVYLDKLSDAFRKLFDDISILDFSALDLSAVEADFKSIGEVIKEFGDVVMHLDEYKQKIVDFFDFKNEQSGINQILGKGQEFVDWYKQKMAPLFSNNTIAATAGGGGMIWLFFQLARSISGVADILKGGGKTLTELPKTLKSIRKALDSYTHGVDTENIKNIAKAIAILAGAIFLLALIKPERLIPAVIALGVVGVLFITALAIWKKGGKEATTIYTVLDTVAAGFKKALTNLTKALATKALGNAILKFAISIGIIVGSIFAVMKMVQSDGESFKTAIITISGIFASLTLLAILMTALGQKMWKGMAAFGAAGAGVLAMSLAIIAMLYAVKMLADMDLSNVKNVKAKIAIFIGVIAAVAAMVLVFAFANKIASKMGSFSVGKGGLKRTSFGGGVGAMPIIAATLMILAAVYAIKMLFEMDFPANWKSRLGILAGIFLGIIVIIAILAGATKNMGKGASGLLTMIGIAILMGVLISSLNVLKTINSRDLLKSVLALGGVLIALAICLRGAGKITSMGAAATVLSLCLMVVVMIGALSYLSLLSGKELLKGAIALGTVLILLAITFAAAGKIQNEGSWKSILAMIGIIIAVAGSLFVLSGKDWKGLLAAAVSMGLVLLALSKVFDSISEMEGDGIGEKLTAMGTGLLALVVIAGILTWLSALPWENVLASGAALSACILAYGKAFQMMGDVEEVSMKTIGAFLLGSLAFIVIGAALWICARYPWEQLAAAGAAISLCIIALAGAMRILATIPETGLGPAIASAIVGAIACILIGAALSIAAQYPWQNLIGAAGAIGICLLALAVSMGIMAAVGSVAAAGVIPAAGMVLEGLIAMFAIAEVLKDLASLDTENLMTAAIGLSMCLIGLAYAMAICAGIGAMGWAGIIGIGVLDAFLLNLTGVLYALSELADLDVLKDGGQKLEAIGEAIGKFAGAIIGGFAENALGGIGKGFANIGQSLSDFMDNAQGFFDGLKDIDSSMIESAKSLVGVILALSAADFIDALTNLIDPIGALKEMILGDNNGFADTLQKLGEGLTAFSEATSGIQNTDDFKTLAEAAGYIVDLTKSLPNSGGWLGTVMGENDADKWGAMVESLGKSMVALSETIEGASFDKFEEFAKATQKVVDMTSTLPNSGGWLGTVMGENDADDWGKRVAKLGYFMSLLSRRISGMSFDNFEPFAKATQTIVDMTSTLPNSGGWLGTIMGENDADEWGAKVYTMARHLKNIAIMITGVNFSEMPAFATAALWLVEATKPFSNLEVLNIDTETWCNNIKTVAQTVADVSGTIVDVDTSKLLTMSTCIRDLTTALTELTNSDIKDGKINKFSKALTDLATTGITKFTEEITNNTPNAVAAIKAFADALIKALDEYTDKFHDMGVKHATAYINGLKSMYEQAYTTGKMLGMKAYSGLELQIKNFERIGVLCAQGFANGLKSSEALKAIADAAAAVGQTAVTATQNAVQTQSPSRVFMKIGNYCGEGLAIGLYQWADAVAEAGNSLGESAKTGLQMAVENLNNHMDEIVDLNPTITPVVDLTYASAAASKINSMFSSAMFRTSSDVRSVSSMVQGGRISGDSEEIQNGRFGNNYTFVQNNNSPKALSRLDIYRDTKNLLRQVEGV